MSKQTGRSESPKFASSEVPLYYQLSTILREQIVSGAYAPGDQLSTEADLVSEYGVSRITVRQALKSIEDEGLIRREAGRGTFVTEEARGPDAFQMDGSLDDLISMSEATSVQLLDLRAVVATERDAKSLGVTVGSALMQCTRLRHYHEEPYSYIVNRLPKEIADQLSEHDWQIGAILQAIQEKLGLTLADADQSVRATLADATLARFLKTQIGAPLLSVDRIVRTDAGRAVEHVHTYYRGDIYSLMVHLERDPEGNSSRQGWRLKNGCDS